MLEGALQRFKVIASVGERFFLYLNAGVSCSFDVVQQIEHFPSRDGCALHLGDEHLHVHERFHQARLRLLLVQPFTPNVNPRVRVSTVQESEEFVSSSVSSRKKADTL